MKSLEEKRLKKNEYQRKYYATHQEQLREYRKKWYQEHKEETIETNNKWKEKNRDKVRNYSKEYMKSHPEIGKKCYNNFKEKHNWSKYCSDARKRRAERLKEQGITNVWGVIVRGEKPKYKEV